MLSPVSQNGGFRCVRLSSSFGAMLLLLLIVPEVHGWGSSSSVDMSSYSNGYNRDWLSDGSAISLQIEGCVYSFPEDNDDSGCMEKDSETGTELWYQMQMCKRPNVVYSLYASSGSSASCNSGNYKETFVTKYGLSEFVYLLQQYDANNPFSSYDDDGNSGGWDVSELPMCESDGNGKYYGVGCQNGKFTIDYYSDAYCQVYSSTYDSLSTINTMLSQYKSCSLIYNSNSDYNAAQYLIPYADVCTSLDSSICQDSAVMSSRTGSSGGILHKRSVSSSGYYKSWGTKAKYVMGGLLLLAAFIMFTGILFTNRRRRRALLQRKFRQRQRSRKSQRSSKSRSKSRDGRHSSTRSSSTRRSKSRPRTERTEETSGVLT